MTTKHTTLTGACETLRTAGFKYYQCSESWHHADGRSAYTRRGVVTRGYYIVIGEG